MPSLGNIMRLSVSANLDRFDIGSSVIFDHVGIVHYLSEFGYRKIPHIWDIIVNYEMIDCKIVKRK